ncbi:putative ribonuclease H-like domain-containing protein [Tanacetum coccineum]
MNEFCGLKGIKREFSVARTPQQNGVAERKNMTLIEAARTMLVDSLLPTVFWAKAVNTACYVLNRVLVTKPHNKTPYELIIGRPPSISFMRPFECPVTILNTLEPLGKFDGKAKEGFLVGYSVNNKAFRNVLDKMMDQEKEATKQSDAVRKELKAQCNRELLQGKATRASNTNSFNTVSTPVNVAGTPRTSNDVGPLFVPLGRSFPFDVNDLPDDPLMPDLDDTAEVQNTGIFGSAYDDDDLDTYNSPYADQVIGAEAHLNNMEPLTIHEPTKIGQALNDESWVEAMQEELLQFKIQKNFRKSLKVEKSLYGLHKLLELGMETLSPIARQLILPMDKLMTDFVHKETNNAQTVPDELNGRTHFFLGLQFKQKEDGIFISQDKYVGEILKKFGFSSIRTASTPVETNKALTKDEDGEDVDVRLYRPMIGSMMYLTSSRPDIMFSVCACSRFQVQPKVSHLNAVKRIFGYLKGRPKLGLWYPKDSPFILEVFSDSDYAGASLDRKSTTGGCQFLGSRLISWQCKKQNVVANSNTEAKYIVASHCCGQVLWIQNQMLDYGYNFMQTKIHVDNESAICVVKNPVYHSRTKRIEIRHHFIRDSHEKILIEMVKIHTDNNVADLLTKAFDRDYTQVLFGLKLEGKHDDQLLNTAGLSFLYLKKPCTDGISNARWVSRLLVVEWYGSSVACDDEVEEMKMKVVVMMMTRGCWWYDGVDRDDGDGVDMVAGERRRRGRGGSGDQRL